MKSEKNHKVQYTKKNSEYSGKYIDFNFLFSLINLQVQQ